MSEATLLSWIALAAIVTIAPGPDVLLVTSHAGRRGFRTGFAAACGIMAGGFWYIMVCGLGFLSLLALFPVIFLIVRIGGALYLAWLGARLLLGAIWPAEASSDSARHLAAPFRQGLLSTILNPKVALFYLAVLPQFVGTGRDAALRGMLLIAIHYGISAPWLALVSFVAARAGTAFRAGPVMRWIEGLLGVAFIGVAGRLATARR